MFARTTFIIVCLFAVTLANLQLPPNDGPEKNCFDVLRNHPKEDLELRCQTLAMEKYVSKFGSDNRIGECCALYDILDCLQHEASVFCDKSQLDHMNKYHFNSIELMHLDSCKHVPYPLIGDMCSPDKKKKKTY